MKPSVSAGTRSIGLMVAVLGLMATTAPASADWTRVTEIPVTAINALWANGDTIAAGVDTAVYVSTDAGASWKRSAKPAPNVVIVSALWIRNGRLYAGTYGQGVFISDDLGASWSPFNQGLVGGFDDSQLNLSDLQMRGDSMYAATQGAGVYVRHLAAAGTWHPFGAELELNQGANVNDLTLGGSRLIASAGVNGQVFHNDSPDADWIVSNLDNLGLQPGLSGKNTVWNGNGWVVGTNFGVFSSVAGQEPWTRSAPIPVAVDWVALAALGAHLFAAFDLPAGAVVEESDDDGLTWQDLESFPGAFIVSLAICEGQLFAARQDGLWRRSSGTAAVPVIDPPAGLHFAVVGPQPSRDRTQLHFELREASVASIRVFDVLGRSVGDRVEEWRSSGPHEMTLDTRRLSPGVYTVLLTTGRQRAAVRVVHVR